MAERQPNKLSRREREIVDVIYSVGGEASAEDVRGRLTDPPTSSAVRAMLTRLEHKGLLRHREDGPRFLYSPTTSSVKARRSALQKIVDVFFQGSPRETVAALIQHEEWSDVELDALSAEINEMRNRKNRR